MPVGGHAYHALPRLGLQPKSDRRAALDVERSTSQAKWGQAPSLMSSFTASRATIYRALREASLEDLAAGVSALGAR